MSLASHYLVSAYDWQRVTLTRIRTLSAAEGGA